MDVRPSVREAGSMSKRREAAFVEPAHDGEVEVGERVTVLELTTGAVSDYRIGEGGVSPDSPLGSALLGRHVGDVVDVALAGVGVRLEIVEIDG
jgi:transcription elongation GreA/GreB family factor